MNTKDIQREPLVKIDGWLQRLNSYAYQVKNEPFKYGHHDCIKFCAEALEQMTYINLRDEFISHMQLSKTGLKNKQFCDDIISMNGGFFSLIDKILSKFGIIMQPISKAKVGDIIFSNDPMETIGICFGETTAFTGNEGLVHRKTFEQYSCWEVK